ncbi:ribonuclease J [Rickettsia endosymbiont of Cardiosporidium cionae]|uniref:ribonuclease J n=1 Tax=Rickettsia endosymbiont of Cardiosporidium cionae TaxID=2777155 RepID=UPI0018951626|nr:ribonuclease J [Rickettsia endosymbiont of Cardiosporidium cionae]KAF8818175.1 RNase J family beta-CASP ribonuclease [Rickettsia endosymbiont of Cardiosporidium cionae]
MEYNIKDFKDKLLFIPLGGTDEIGMNVNLYHLDGKWIMVDCGSGFPNEDLPGVDMLVADISFVEEHKDDLLAIIITHAHEDHLGGIQYLWNSLQVPIYTNKFTKNVLIEKLKYFQDKTADIQINEIGEDSVFTLGPFSLEMVHLNHSIPEMHGILISTQVGNILHTGDWKFDSDPIIREKCNVKKLKEYGKRGVLALVCDSTNVFEKIPSKSEGEVRKNLLKIIGKCQSMIFITTFASNIARLDSILYAARSVKRKVVIVGRSMHIMIQAAQNSGYLLDYDSIIIPEKDIKNFARNELLVVSTGCQGELRAGFNKIISDKHGLITMNENDTVIFSSKIIPGNEKQIFSLINQLVRRNINVITEKDDLVHVSGHPSVSELDKMYSLISPKISIPVHGEPIHIHRHVQIAKSSGVNDAVMVANGDIVEISMDGSNILGKVKNGYLAIDGNYMLPVTSDIFKLRLKMQNSGIVLVNIFTDKFFKILRRPSFIAPGLLDKKYDSDLIKYFVDKISDAMSVRESDPKRNMSKIQINSYIKYMLTKLIYKELKKSPVILVNIEEMNY